MNFKTADELGMTRARYDILVNNYNAAVAMGNEVQAMRLEDVLTGQVPDAPPVVRAAVRRAATKRAAAKRSKVAAVDGSHPWAEDEE